MADDDDDASSLITKLVICLIAAASAAVVVTFYHCITTGHILTILRRTGRTAVPQQPPPQRRTSTTVYEQDQSQQQNSSIENSLAELIPSHKYQKGGSGGGGDGVGGLVAEHDGMCAVCLSDFEEGEMLRTLPECMHSYHAPCIDMWLYSHSNCPMCRTNAAPSTSPQMLMHLLESANSETPPTSRPLVALFPLQQQMPATRHNLHTFRV